MIILNNKAYYNAQDKLECYYPYGAQSTSVIYVPYSADDRDFDPGNYIDENMLLEFDESEYTVADYGTWGFYTIQGVDKKWRILQIDMKWVLPEGIASKSAGIVNALKPFLDYENMLKVLKNENDHKKHADAVTKALRNAIQADSSTGKRVRVKKIIIDYPAYIYDYERSIPFKRHLNTDGYDTFQIRAYNNNGNSIVGLDPYGAQLYGGTGRKPIIPDEKATYRLDKDFGYITPSINHTQLLYPDENYWHNDYKDLTNWLNWLDNNRRKIAFVKDIDIPDNPTTIDEMNKKYNPETYISRLNTLIYHIKKLDNFADYSFGILLQDIPNNANIEPADILYAFPVSIALFSGDYIKIPKSLEMDTLRDTFIDLTYSSTRRPTWHYATAGPSSRVIDDAGITIGFVDSINEEEYLKKRPAILITAAPSSIYERYINEICPVGVQKLNTELYKLSVMEYAIPYLTTWNIYSEILIPYDLFNVKGEENKLYSKYAHGEKLKYRTRFKKSPVFTFPLFTGYFSHALRYNEGIIPGRER